MILFSFKTISLPKKIINIVSNPSLVINCQDSDAIPLLNNIDITERKRITRKQYTTELILEIFTFLSQKIKVKSKMIVEKIKVLSDRTGSRVLIE